MAGTADQMIIPTPDVPAASSQSDDFLLLNGQKIDEKDRKEILETIDRVAAENRLSAGPGPFTLHPTKKGFVFPLAVNLAAAVAVVAGFVGANVYFSKQQSTISSQAGTFFSAEGKLIEQVRKEAQAKLQQKDVEIQSIQGKLTQLDQESTALKSNMQATIQAKESELKTQMQTELEAEKARLQKLGISQTEIDRRMKAFEDQKNAQFAQQLGSYRAQSEAALAEKEKQIQAQAEQSRQILAQANQQRQDLLNQAQKDEAQLRTQYEAQAQALQSANQTLAAQSSAAQAKIQALSLQSQNEQLLTDQIVGSYGAILSDIQAADYPKAQGDMNALKALLEGVDASALPDIAKRRPVDLQLIASLQELIKARTQPGQAVVDPAVVERAKLVSDAEGIVTEAQAEQKKGNAGSAETLYEKALALIPPISQAFTAVREALIKDQTAKLAERDAAAQALKTQSDRQTQAIAELTKKLDTANAAIAASDATLRTTQASSVETQASLTGTQSAVDALRKQLADKNDQVALLTKELEKSTGSVKDLEDQLAKAGAKVSDLEKQVASQSGGAANVEGALAAANSQVADLKQQLTASRKQTQDLTTQLTQSQAKLAESDAKLKEAESGSAKYAATIASLQGDYTDYKTQLLSLISTGTPQDIARAQSILLQFVGRPAFNDVLPGFSGVVENVGKDAVTLAQKQGHDAALDDVLSVTSYLSGNDNSAQSAAARQAIAQKAASDPLFRSMASGIQQLAQKEGTTQGRQAVSAVYHLIGTISYVSTGTVTVEKLVNLAVKQGELVQIRHKSAAGPEVPIAEGTVSAVSTDSVEVTVKGLLQGTESPRLLDVVYLETQTGT
ncbi:MAG TPA: hypothetical protein VMV68_05300 [Spirochaetia bacterium]|nr:hypothetical protein [Spirochaetia bacterium]